mmetsp:Transcript_116183/g.328716  ORF Transcript_116183/g.328716 Transcript_116183/m.328716 type:complete len:257 (+) Transcript_116183:87-857(+)
MDRREQRALNWLAGAVRRLQRARAPDGVTFLVPAPVPQEEVVHMPKVVLQERAQHHHVVPERVGTSLSALASTLIGDVDYRFEAMRTEIDGTLAEQRKDFERMQGGVLSDAGDLSLQPRSRGDRDEVVAMPQNKIDVQWRALCELQAQVGRFLEIHESTPRRLALVESICDEHRLSFDAFQSQTVELWRDFKDVMAGYLQDRKKHKRRMKEVSCRIDALEADLCGGSEEDEEDEEEEEVDAVIERSIVECGCCSTR